SPSGVNGSVTPLIDGGFVVTWEADDGSAYGIHAKRYDANGLVVAEDFVVNTYTASYQFNSSVAGLLSGGFIVAWTSEGQDGLGYGIYAQLYDADGNRVNGEFRVSGLSSHDRWQPAVAALLDGGFEIV